MAGDVEPEELLLVLEHLALGELRHVGRRRLLEPRVAGVVEEVEEAALAGFAVAFDRGG